MKWAPAHSGQVASLHTETNQQIKVVTSCSNTLATQRGPTTNMAHKRLQWTEFNCKIASLVITDFSTPGGAACGSKQTSRLLICPPHLQSCFPLEAPTAHWGNWSISRKKCWKMQKCRVTVAVFIELLWSRSDCLALIIRRGRSAVVMDRRRRGLHITGPLWKSRTCDGSWNMTARASREQTVAL